jgi:shikimate dehydrogenase
MVAYNGKAKLVGVLGNPISHSLSPAIHEYWLQKYKINGVYVPLRVQTDKFEQTVETLLGCGFIGFNVTLPHKVAAYEIAKTHDRAATICGVANTLVMQSNGGLHAINSDSFGFVKMLEYAENRKEVKRDTALLLGAGGAARAIVLALQIAGFKRIIIANRTIIKATELITDLQKHTPNAELIAIELAEIKNYINDVNLLINSLSIDSRVSDTILDLPRVMAKNAWLVDVSYGINGTEMTRAAGAYNIANIDGLMMLLWQATSGFEQWFGVTPEVDAGLVEHVKAMIKL